MRTMMNAAGGVVLAGAMLAPAAVQADGLYVSGSIGAGFLSDSDNSGAFPNGFDTGEGVVLPAGADVGWTTEFDTGFTGAVALGKRWSENLRSELEIAYQSNDVDTHTGVSAAGLALGTLDAGILVPGTQTVGVSVGDLVAAGEGSVESLYVMVNGYYDFPTATGLTPYIGAGIGYANVDVEYAPSATTIIDDDAGVFAYQIMVGAAFNVTETTELFGGYRYRGTTDVEVDASLFPAELDIENGSSILEIGARINF